MNGPARRVRVFKSRIFGDWIAATNEPDVVVEAFPTWREAMDWATERVTA